ncbi:DUF2207 domain-containing protein [Patescibacteria group bacterium]|nr:DUF2207 domain-containing protein [Patescibacteria group bacterium]
MIAFLLAFFAIFYPAHVTHAQTTDAERVTSFNVQAAMNRGDDLLVRETISYDFGSNEKHGIYRYIPNVMTVGVRRINLGLHVLGVLRDGVTEQTTNSTENDNVFMKIGDPDRTMSGAHVYQLQYSVAHLVVNEAEQQRVSWNVTGNGWKVPIDSATFLLDTPAIPTRVDCFTGPIGSTQHACTVSTSGTQVMARTVSNLYAGSGLTVEAFYPPGTFVSAVTDVGELPWWAMPWLAFSVLISLIWGIVWFFFGRDPKGRGTIIPEYDPPADMKPYEVNALANDGVTHRGVAATILDLSRRGIIRLTILDEGNNYRIERLRNKEKNLDTFESGIVSMLFLHGDEAVMTGHDQARATVYQMIHEWTNAQLKTRGWHQWNITFMRGAAIAAAVVSWGIGMALLNGYFNDPRLFLSVIGLFLAMIFAYYMPKRTPNGARLLEQIDGFKLYVHVAEKDRLAFHEAPEKTPERFSALLPFAVALGIEKSWGALFADLAVSPTSQNSMMMTALQASAFAHTFSSDVRSFATAPSSSSGSGGSSGGGGGGGGGGSW